MSRQRNFMWRLLTEMISAQFRWGHWFPIAGIFESVPCMKSRSTPWIVFTSWPRLHLSWWFKLKVWVDHAYAHQIISYTVYTSWPLRMATPTLISMATASSTLILHYMSMATPTLISTIFFISIRQVYAHLTLYEYGSVYTNFYFF